MSRGDIEKFWPGWLRLLIHAGWHLMTPFLEFILINTHNPCILWVHMVWPIESYRGSAVFYSTATLKILKFLYAKGMKMLSIAVM
jgi:hypothetical protein